MCFPLSWVCVGPGSFQEPAWAGRARQREGLGRGLARRHHELAGICISCRDTRQVFTLWTNRELVQIPQWPHWIIMSETCSASTFPLSMETFKTRREKPWECRPAGRPPTTGPPGRQCRLGWAQVAWLQPHWHLRELLGYKCIFSTEPQGKDERTGKS